MKNITAMSVTDLEKTNEIVKSFTHEINVNLEKCDSIKRHRVQQYNDNLFLAENEIFSVEKNTKTLIQ